MRIKTNNIIIRIIITIIIVFYPQLSIAETICELIKVISGDTIICMIDKKVEIVRLLGIETPDSTPTNYKRNIDFGKMANEYTKKALEKKKIILEFIWAKRDVANRLLAYAFVDNVNLSVSIVREGLSPYCTKYGGRFKYDADFIEAEKYAMMKSKNIWSSVELSGKYRKMKLVWDRNKNKLFSN